MPVEPKPEPIPAAPGGKWQFGIRHLLGLMTYCGIVLGIATWQGPPTLVVTLGLGVALLSHLGALERLQKGRTQLILAGLAWITYLVSLCTPCTTGPFTVFGWLAAWIYFWEPIASMFKSDSRIELPVWPWLVSINLANALQLILPLHIWRLSRGRGEVLTTLSCLAMVGPWTTLIFATDLYVAYYIWCVSFMLLAIALPIGRLTLVGMAGLAILHITIFRIFETHP
ncbi:MAG: hypothetical protein IAF94_03765 [Pirellulaceae bacterium]|nr:hypothetical protein [Pirellulaceae bacterium]